jgi:hypothetical protein
MSQVKNMLIEIADEAADITLDNCPGRGLPFSLQVSNAAELEAEVQDIAREAYQSIVFESYSDLFNDSILEREFNVFWNDFWKWNHENLIKSYGFEL